MIESLQNPRVKALARLQKRRERLRTQTMLVFGQREILRAWAAGWKLHEVWIDAGEGADLDWLAPLRKASIPEVLCRAEVLSKIGYREVAEGGALAVADLPRWTFEDLVPRLDRGPLIFLESCEKPGNLGAILRSVDGAGAAGVLLSSDSVDLGNPNVLRASLGTLFHVPVVPGPAEELAEFMAAHELPIFATTPEASVAPWQVPLGERCVLAFGSEKDGLSRAWLERAQARVALPMRGIADSLNLSASTAVFLYEAMRQGAGGAPPA